MRLFYDASYGDMPWFVEEVFGYQSLDDELESLSSRYGQPVGRALIAMKNDSALAGGAYRRLSETICELKRVYVTDEARGCGLGRKLSETLISTAKADGYTTMQLDTGDRLNEAIAMYESLGFNRIAPYQAYPERLMPYLVFMEKALYRTWAPPIRFCDGSRRRFTKTGQDPVLLRDSG